MAGVAGFEPPNGGIKIVTSIINRLLILFTRLVPSTPFDSPSLPPKLPPAFEEAAVALGPVRGGKNYLLSAVLRRPAEPCHVTPIRPQADQRIARDDSTGSRKVALRLISRGLTTALGKFLSHPGIRLLAACTRH
jgi:hypothetical protein